MTELKRILYAEDEPDIQVVAQMALESLGGFEVKICSSGEEALDAYSEYKPQLVLLDVMMPGMDGTTTLQELKKLPDYEGTPVVFMTAKVQRNEMQQYKELGAVDVITKPFNPMTLSDTIKEIWNNL